MIALKLPELGENIETAEVSRLLVKEGDEIAAEQSVMELDSEKASFPLPCPHAGRVAKLHVKEGDTVKIGQTLLEVEEKADGDGKAKTPKAEKREEEPKPKAREKEPEPAKPEPKATGEERARPAPPKEKAPARREIESESVPAGPATRHLARELGVQLEEVRRATGGRRITREDVKAFVEKRLQSPAEQPAPELPDFARWGAVKRQRQNALARAAAERLSLAWRLVPHVTQNELADITDLEAQRVAFNDRPHGKSAKITMTVLAVKAVITALKTYPKFNSSLDSESQELILKEYFHIGVAVDTEQGLLVPVLRDADRKSIATLATELADLAEKARNRQLTPRDMEGGTFTISNLGGIGGGHFTPIVNYPEVAILGIGRASRQLVPQGDSKVSRLLLPLSLSYDHRVINGADGARFSRKIAELLGDPFHFFIES